jgi:hypothetical protein
VTLVPAIETTAITLGTMDAQGNFHPVATTSCTLNTRGKSERISTQFADGIPAESETIAGKGAFKPGHILIQHQLHDGREKCRCTITGFVDNAGGLAWYIDSTTVDPDGSKGQESSAPLVLNVGAGKGMYLVLHEDGRIKLMKNGIEYTTTVDKLTERLARNE